MATPVNAARRQSGRTLRLYVGNLSFAATEGDLREIFNPFGEPDSLTVVVDRSTGRSKGFGFVDFSDNAKANAAMSALKGKELHGRMLRVNEARPRESSGDRNKGYRR
jgi:cold-inducible RNA-binding protein